jgi:hypothetical protein
LESEYREGTDLRRGRRKHNRNLGKVAIPSCQIGDGNFSRYWKQSELGLFTMFVVWYLICCCGYYLDYCPHSRFQYSARDIFSRLGYFIFSNVAAGLERLEPWEGQR